MLGSLNTSLKNVKHKPMIVSLFAAVLLLAAGAAGWFLFPHGGQQPQGATTYPPVTSDIQPADGAVIRGTEAWITWQPLTQARGRVLWRTAGDSDFQTVEAGGYPLVARLAGLKQGAKYEYIVEDTVEGHTERSTLRIFTVQGGLVFDSDVVEPTVNRDYYQTVTLNLHNTSPDKLVVGAKALVHFDDLPADIVGPGSVDEPVEVPPGGTLPLNLAVTAPDARQNTYDIPVEAAGAYALARVHINAVNFKLSYDVVNEDPHTLAKTIDIHNDGDSLADLAVGIATPNQDSVRIQPSVTHGYLPSGQTLEMVVAPVLYLEFQTLSAQLEVGAGGQSARFPLDFAAPAGQQLVGLRTDPDERSVSRDWYCTNKPNTCSNVPGPDGSGPATQASGSGDGPETILLASVHEGDSTLAGISSGPAAVQGSCSTCNTGQACKDIAALRQLIDDNTFLTANHYPGSFFQFVSEFDPLSRHLSVNDLACRYDPGSNIPPQVSMLISDILGARNSFKTLNSSSEFPGKVPCDKDVDTRTPKAECDDRQAIGRIFSDLQQLASALGCPQAGPAPTVEPSGGCPAGEETKSSDTDKALQPVIDGFKKALEKIDEELRLNPASEGLREQYERLQKVKELLEHIKAGSCVPSNLVQTLNEVSQGREGACPEFCNALFNWLKKMGLAKDSDRDTFLPGCSTSCEEAMLPGGK